MDHINTGTSSLSFYRTQSLLASQHLLIFSVCGDLLPEVTMSGTNSHLGRGKVWVLHCTLFLIRPTYPKLWIWRLWCKEVGRVRIHAFLEQQQHQALWRMGNDRGPPSCVWWHHQAGSGEWFWTFCPRCPRACLLPNLCFHHLCDLHEPESFSGTSS